MKICKPKEIGQLIGRAVITLQMSPQEEMTKDLLSIIHCIWTKKI